MSVTLVSFEGTWSEPGGGRTPSRTPVHAMHNTASTTASRGCLPVCGRYPAAAAAAQPASTTHWSRPMRLPGLSPRRAVHTDDDLSATASVDFSNSRQEAEQADSRTHGRARHDGFGDGVFSISGWWRAGRPPVGLSFIRPSPKSHNKWAKLRRR